MESLSSSVDPVASNVTVAPSAGVWSEPALAEGASLTFTTVRTYSSLTDALDPSVQVTVIVCAPTLALRGVPEIVPELLIDSVLGCPDIL